MAFYYKPLSIFCFLFILANVKFVSSTKGTKKNGFTTDLIHRDSPLSPFYNPSNTRFDRLNRAFQRSFSRKSPISLAHKKSPRGTLDTSHIEAPITPVPGEFLMKFGVGTPPLDVLAIVDTGSDLTWIQCEPCIECYDQITPIFDHHLSSTYGHVPCESQLCAATGIGCDSSVNGCVYEMSYGDGSYSEGGLAFETFTFNMDSQMSTTSFPNVAFGCGHQNLGRFNETAAGIVGLGGGSVSIVNQLQNSTIGGKFSYCLTPLDSNATSKISFGSNAVVTGPNVQSTPLVRKSSDSFYYLTLEGFSVGNNRSGYAPLVSAKVEGEKANIIIDSGTTLTFLPPDLYQSLELDLIETIKVRRASDPSKFFQLCFDISSEGQFNPPPIVAHFKGADLVLPQDSLFVEVKEGLLCLAMVPSTRGSPPAIFGNLNQINYLIGYDLEKQTVNFLPKKCGEAH